MSIFHRQTYHVPSVSQSSSSPDVVPTTCPLTYPVSPTPLTEVPGPDAVREAGGWGATVKSCLF